MKTLKFILPLALVIFFVSCKTSTKKGKEKLDDATQNVETQITTLNETEFSDAVKGFVDLSEFPFYSEKKINFKKQDISKIKNLGNSIKNSFIKKYPAIFNNFKNDDDHFTIEKYAGTYTWNKSSEDWDFSNTPTDQIIVIFPSEGSLTNDCKFVWSKYNDTEINDDYYPTLIYAELFKDDKKIAKVDYEASFNPDAYPTKIKLEFLLDPMKVIFDYTLEDKIMSIKATLKKNNRTIDDLNTEITFVSENLEDDISQISGIFKTYKIENAVNTGVLLKIKYNVDFEAMGEDPDCDKVNDNMDIKIYTSSDRLIGEVICADSDDCDMLILFNDGTTQSVCYYLDQIEKAIEDTFDQYDK